MRNLLIMNDDVDVLEMSKSEINGMANMLVNNFDESSKDPIKMLAFVTKMKTMLDTIEKGLIDKSMNELHSYNGKHFAFGIDFQIAEVGTKYDYSHNTQWVKIQDQINDLEEKRKEVETFIKSLTHPITQVDEETGEAIQWFPASKTSTTTIKKRII